MQTYILKNTNLHFIKKSYIQTYAFSLIVYRKLTKLTFFQVMSSMGNYVFLLLSYIRV